MTLFLRKKCSLDFSSLSTNRISFKEKVMPSFPGCYKPSPDRKRILCPVFSRVQQQDRQQCNLHAAAPTVLFLSDLSTRSLAESSPTSIVVQPQGLAELAAAEDGHREKYKLLPLEVWMAIFVGYETAAVTGGDVGGGKAHVL